MARIDTSGLGDIARQILEQSDKTERAAKKMLEAGAEVVKNEQVAEIKKTFASDRSTGALANSIKASKVKKKGSEYYIEVAPTGKDKKGVRNATKGFVLEYGRSNMPARPWMTRANEKSQGKVDEAMRGAFDEVMNGEE